MANKPASATFVRTALSWALVYELTNQAGEVIAYTYRHHMANFWLMGKGSFFPNRVSAPFAGAREIVHPDAICPNLHQCKAHLYKLA